MDERPIAPDAEDDDSSRVTAVPAVRCTGCAYTWNSPAMADGLRLLGSCPRCAGELAFRDPAPRVERFTKTGKAAAATAPHLVLGFPRR